MTKAATIYHCPVEVTAEVIGGKWTTVILAQLKESPRRYSELRRLVPDITEKMLAQRLRELEAAAIVRRGLSGGMPPGYRPAVRAACRWAIAGRVGSLQRRGARGVAPRTTEFY